MVASLTAAFVLMCSIYCACGDASSAADASCHTAQAAEAQQQPHCHGHAASVPAGHAAQGGGNQRDSNPHHGDEGGCGHCKRTVTTINSVKAHSGLLPDVASFDVVAVCVVLAQGQTALHIPACSGDLPPPQGLATLLSLHCALNT